MLQFLCAVLFAWHACLVFASNTDLQSVLAAQPDLSEFTSLIDGYPNLLAAAQAGNMTIIAPNNEAFTTFFASQSSMGTNYSTPDQIYALLQYHVLTGAYGSVAFTSTPLFIPTLLVNSSYTNVTNGQVVEAVTNGSAITFRSAVHQVATIVGSTNDILFLGGYIHIVDAVMVPPLNALATVADYPLTYYVETISVVLNGNFTQVVQNITNLPNQTYFCANDEAQAQMTYNSTGTVTADEIMEFLEYTIIPGEAVYSTAFTNGSKWPTLLAVDVTITEYNGDLYVNDAKILVKDLLIANGVIHVIDKYLNASDANARPQMNGSSTSTSSSSSESKNGANGQHGLSTGAKAGIGVGVAIAILAILIGMAVFYWKKRRTVPHDGGSGLEDKKRPKQRRLLDHVMEADDRQVMESDNRPVHEKEGSRKRPTEMITKPYDAAELDAQNKMQELDGQEVKTEKTTPTEWSWEVNERLEEIHR